MNRFGLFKIGEFAFAVALEHIQKILQDSKMFKLPRLPQVVSAVLVDAGQLVPLLDLEQIFGNDSQLEPQQSGYQVLVGSEYGAVALPANLSGQIVAVAKGTLSKVAGDDDSCCVADKFVYQNEEYNVLDINYLAIEMTQGFWQNQPDTGGARRHQ